MKLSFNILAAGKGTRMGNLTKDTNKCLLLYKGKPILGHIIDSISDYTDTISIIVHYKREQIIEYCNKNYPDIKFNFIYQKELKGTANAISYLEKDFDFYFITMGDTIYDKFTIKSLIDNFNEKNKNIILVDKVKNPEKYGVLNVESNIVTEIEEKPINPKSNIINLGTYILDKSIFNYIKNTNESKSGEIYITDTFQNMINDGIKLYVHYIEEKYKDLTFESDLNQ